LFFLTEIRNKNFDLKLFGFSITLKMLKNFYSQEAVYSNCLPKSTPFYQKELNNMLRPPSRALG